MGVPVLLQRGEAEHLLSGGDTQLAVNVFVVVFQRVGGDPQLQFPCPVKEKRASYPFFAVRVGHDPGRVRIM